jgi:hypothetical protein
MPAHHESTVKHNQAVKHKIARTGEELVAAGPPGA